MKYEKHLAEAEEELARASWLEENVENSVKCPICGGVLKLSVAVFEDAEKESEEVRSDE